MNLSNEFIAENDDIMFDKNKNNLNLNSVIFYRGLDDERERWEREEYQREERGGRVMEEWWKNGGREVEEWWERSGRMMGEIVERTEEIYRCENYMHN